MENPIAINNRVRLKHREGMPTMVSLYHPPKKNDGMLFCDRCTRSLDQVTVFYCKECQKCYCRACLLLIHKRVRCPACKGRCGSHEEPIISQYPHRAYRERRNLNKSICKKIYERDNYRCRYCGKDASCIDHLTPYSRGGSDDLTNLVASCTICNAFASNKVFYTFQDKADFIMQHRKEKRIDSEHHHSICAECSNVYPFGSSGSSLFFCSVCYPKM